MYLRDNTQDAHMLREVYLDNEYRLPAAFNQDDVIFDVGAHIGAFALACLHRGAGRVVCFEPERSNFDLLCRNLEQHGRRVAVFNKAVWKPGVQVAYLVSGHPVNTAIHQTTDQQDMGVPCACISLDKVLRNYPRVRLLKLDCEYAEYPILQTCRELGRVEEVVGEAHLGQRTADGTPLDGQTVAALLDAQGFETEVVPHPRAPECLSFFFAKRLP